MGFRNTLLSAPSAAKLRDEGPLDDARHTRNRRGASARMMRRRHRGAMVRLRKVAGASSLMASPESAAPPSPMPVFDAVHGFHRTAALKGALALDLFSLIAAGATTVEDLAARCEASPRG